MSDVMTIPVLPCSSLTDTLRFYRALGFEVTHEQTRPNVYGATRRGDIHLHFMGLKNLDPAHNSTTCLVMVADVEPLYAAFRTGLRQAYGKLPVRGRPRVTRWRTGLSRFTLVDPAGNSLIFIRQDAPDDYDEGEVDADSESELARALRWAARTRDFQTNDRGAAKLLDQALSKPAVGSEFERARVLVARSELAIALGDPATAARLQAELAQLALSEGERARLQPELEHLRAIEQSQS